MDFVASIFTNCGRMRQKLEENPEELELIIPVSGVGYRFVGRKEAGELIRRG